MSEKLKRRLLVGIYSLAMVVMAGSLALVCLRPPAFADTCPSTGTPCDLTNGVYACTGGINGAPPIPGCACDMSNFCTGDVR